MRILNGKQCEFPTPPWAGVKRVHSAASLFLCIGTPYYSLEPHVIGLAKPAHSFRDRTWCRPKDSVFRDLENLRFSNDAGPVSRPREGADAHGHTRHGSNRRPLLRWHSRCVRVLSVPRESPQGRARAKLNSPSSFRWLRARDHGEATGHRARGTSRGPYLQLRGQYHPRRLRYRDLHYGVQKRSLAGCVRQPGASRFGP